MKILLAVDGSPGSRRAVDFVTRIGWPAGSRIIVLGTARLEDGEIEATPEAGSAPSDPAQILREKSDLAVSRAVRTLREAGLSAGSQPAFGPARPALIQATCRERVDLVVIGSSSRAGVARRMLHDVSGHFVTDAPCSVLVVKRERQVRTKRPPLTAKRRS
ncbi:MAG: universal stress protein [Candidatus Eiseniibacteriota bacterium]